MNEKRSLKPWGLSVPFEKWIFALDFYVFHVTAWCTERPQIVMCWLKWVGRLKCQVTGWLHPCHFFQLLVGIAVFTLCSQVHSTFIQTSTEATTVTLTSFKNTQHFNHQNILSVYLSTHYTSLLILLQLWPNVSQGHSTRKVKQVFKTLEEVISFHSDSLGDF